MTVTTIVETRVASGADDVEQRGKSMSLTSSDLELVVDGAIKQKVGLRFTNIDIPSDAIITNAYLQFRVAEVGSTATLLQISGIDVDDAAPFTTARNNLSSRPTTSAVVSWQPVAWTLIDEAGAAQRTPDLTVVLQEIIDRGGWQAGNDLAFVITGSGTRTAYAFESSPLKAPLLHIEYTLPESNSPPVIDLDASAAGTGYAAVFVENSGGIPIADTDVVITDSDDANMERLTVTLTDPKASDLLVVSGSLPAGIAVDPASTASNVILVGSASIAAYQTAVRQVRFNNTSADPDPTARHVQVTVNDGPATSTPAVATISITPVNSAPFLDLDASASGSGFATVFVEGGGGIPIADSDVLITDSDDTNMERLTVTLTDPKASDQIMVNSGGLPAGIAVDSASTASNVILVGTASIAAYQTAVRQVLFNNTSANPDPTARHVQVSVGDGLSTSSPAVTTISINPANSAPVLDLDASASGTGYATIFVEGGGGVKVADSDVQITDADDTQMERLTVTLTNPKAGDQLVVNNGGLPAGIIVDAASSASNVILAGTASIAAYQTAVQQVRFINTIADPDATGRRVEVTVNDGSATSTPAVATIAVHTGSVPTILETRVVSGADDVEQRGTAMSLTSSDLELVVDGTVGQQVGLRFTGISIPAGAIVTGAYLQFQTDEVGSIATSLQIRGVDVDDAAPFTVAANDLSSRPTTTAFASWQPAPWTLIDEARTAQRTPDLAEILQEIIDRSGWQEGNDLAFVITGTGTRTARAFESGATKAPLLHIEYTLPSSSTGDIVLTQDAPTRENSAGALVGSLSVADPEPGVTYVFSTTDERFEVVGNQLELKDGVRLDFERNPAVNIDITATGSGGQTLTDTVTASVSDVAETRFAAFGDYGSNAGTGPVSQLVDSLSVDFIITTGDNVYDLDPIDDQIGRFYSNYIGNYAGAYGPGSATNRFFPSLGNHEYLDPAGGTNASAYLDYFTLPGNERYYDFVQGPVHFFVVNSNSEEPDGRSSTSIQAQWLQQGLAASTSPYNIVYFHHPPFSSGDHHGSSVGMQWPFEQWGATAVLAGHDHIYERILRDDDGDGTVLPYFVTGLGGNTRYGFGLPVAGSAVRYSSDWGTMLIQASDESITFEFVAITGGGMGTVIDSYTIERTLQAASGNEAPIIATSAQQADTWPRFGPDIWPFGPATDGPNDVAELRWPSAEQLNYLQLADFMI
jgi:hypothetical protein